MESKYVKLFLLLIILAICFITIFYKLGYLTFHVWDEARNVNNAIEMSESKNFLVPTYLGEEDTWNTKPPLLIIIQSIFINLFGLSELSVRLPSAIAVTLTVVFVFLFISKFTKSNFIAFFSSFILLTTPGMVAHHGVRTGDYEATLLLLCVLYSLFYLCYIETKKSKYLYLFSIAFTLAFMTKSSAALLFIPALFIYSIYRRRLVSILTSKHFYISLAIPLIVVGCYYAYREVLHPGFLKIIFENEFGGRYLSTLEGHKQGTLYYFDLLKDSRLKYWFFMAIPGLIFTFFEKNYRIKRLFIFLSLLSITHLVIISLSSTKLSWYVLPEFPFWSIMAAISLYQTIYWISRLLKIKIVNTIIATILTAAVLYLPITDTIDRIKHYEKEKPNCNAKMFLRDEITKFIDKDSKVAVLTTFKTQHLYPYLHILKRQGYNVEIGHINKIYSYEIVLLDESERKKTLVNSVNTMFVTETITEFQKAIVLSRIVKERSYEEAVDYALQQLGDSSEDTESNKIKAESMVTDAMSVLGYKK